MKSLQGLKGTGNHCNHKGLGCYCPQSQLLQFSSVQLLSPVGLFATPWTAARQASLSITNSWSLLKPMSIESVMPSNHLILCRPLLLLPSVFPSIRVSSSESVLCIIFGQSIGASVLPMNIQDWFPLGWTGWISLQSKGLSRVFSNIVTCNLTKPSSEISLYWWSEVKNKDLRKTTSLKLVTLASSLLQRAQLKFASWPRKAIFPPLIMKTLLILLIRCIYCEWEPHEFWQPE